MFFKKIFPILFFFVFFKINAQHSIARKWNEVLLEAIRNDFARPTVHARNLFHSSVLMYDSWAIFNKNANPYFLGKNEFTSDFNNIATPTDNLEQAISEVMSYALYRLITHRFKNSPDFSKTLLLIDDLFTSLGYDKNFLSTDLNTHSYAALGNYMASKMIEFGLQDFSNEANDYENLEYRVGNPPLILSEYEENQNINPNKWQPLAFESFIDQSGNVVANNTPEFLSPEWGKVTPFALQEIDLDILNNNFESYVYHDPGAPPFIENSEENGIEDLYKWNFALVISWSAHLDANTEEIINISPNAIGNTSLENYPDNFSEYHKFYNFFEGGDTGKGRAINPYTNQPYSDNFVKRGDYGRILAEFWADGPDSETPPGHWFTILNYVSDHPLTKKTFGHSKKELTNLEWDVKSYFTLGGAMHDAAIATWGIKGYYNYIRPISAIRYMAGKGQSTDKNLPNFNSHGLPLIDNLIELVSENDELVGENLQNLHKIKVKSWKGPDYIANEETDTAGVGWILGTKWWPYQRPSFVTPPFSGYVSGHSTFSRAAAEVLTLITNSEFFPGGLGTFEVEKNKFLVFENGPTKNITLQWATYRDASDQTSLSRIWGGIHPPADDIKGRVIGYKVGIEAYNYATFFFDGIEPNSINDKNIYPNPFRNFLTVTTVPKDFKIIIYNTFGKKVFETVSDNIKNTYDLSLLEKGVYILSISTNDNKLLLKKKIVKI